MVVENFFNRGSTRSIQRDIKEISRDIEKGREAKGEGYVGWGRVWFYEPQTNETIDL